VFDKRIELIDNKLFELELVSKFKHINSAKNIIKKGEVISKFTAIVKFPNISKFSELPHNIKSDLDMPIPMYVDLWFLKEGKNRDGIVTLAELIGASERSSGQDIIPFHDKSDELTTYDISDECGFTEGGRIDQDKFGANWAVVSARITNRNIAYQMYLKKLKNKPIEISVEYFSTPKYSDNGEIISTNIRPKLISLVKSGHIKGNKIVIKSEI